MTAPEPCKIPLLFSNFGSLLSRNCQIADIPSSLDCVHKCSATAPHFLHDSPGRKFPPSLASPGHCQCGDNCRARNAKRIHPSIPCCGQVPSRQAAPCPSQPGSLCCKRWQRCESLSQSRDAGKRGEGVLWGVL